MQLACNALYAGERVVWIDTGAPIPGPRFQEMLQSYRGVAAGSDPASSPPIPRSLNDLLEKFTHFNIHTLPHLLVLFLHPTPRFPPQDTALIIIDNVSAPFATAFPRPTPASSPFNNANLKTSGDGGGGGNSGSLSLARKNRLQWAANRKWTVAGDLALAGAAWEVAVANRLVLWRDFAPYHASKGEGTSCIAPSLRFAQAVKVGGRLRPGGRGDAVPFSIETVRGQKTSPQKDVIVFIKLNIIQEGLQELKLPVLETQQPQPQPSSPLPSTILPSATITTTTKRKADEIADSEDELLVGSDDDFALPSNDEDDLFGEAVVRLA